jgi:toxin-antitoxin system PIN domain toxin
MKSYFPDINVWLAMACLGHQHQTAANAWFERLDSDVVYFCRPTQLGFLRLLTHPAVMRDEVKSQLEAWAAYDVLMSDSRVAFYPEPDADEIENELRALTTSPRSTPQQWPDAYLAAFAKVAGLTLVTFDHALSKLAREGVLLLK